MSQQQERWCYYRVFVKGVRNCRTGFIGRCLGSAKSPSNPGIELYSLYQDQDSRFYFLFGPEEVSVPGLHPDFGKLYCLSYFEVKTREELVEGFRRFAKRFGVANPEIPEFFYPPVPEVEDMHTVTGYDS